MTLNLTHPSFNIDINSNDQTPLIQYVTIQDRTFNNLFLYPTAPQTRNMNSRVYNLVNMYIQLTYHVTLYEFPPNTENSIVSSTDFQISVVKQPLDTSFNLKGGDISSTYRGAIINQIYNPGPNVFYSMSGVTIYGGQMKIENTYNYGVLTDSDLKEYIRQKRFRISRVAHYTTNPRPSDRPGIQLTQIYDEFNHNFVCNPLVLRYKYNYTTPTISNTNISVSLNYNKGVIDVSQLLQKVGAANYTASGGIAIHALSMNNIIGYSGNFTDPTYKVILYNTNTSINIDNTRLYDPSYKNSYSCLVWSGAVGLNNSVFDIYTRDGTSVSVNSVGIGSVGIGNIGVDRRFPFSNFFNMNTIIDTSAAYILGRTHSRISACNTAPPTFTPQSLFAEYTANPTYFVNGAGTIPQIIRRTTATDVSEQKMGMIVTQLPAAEWGTLQYYNTTTSAWTALPAYFTLPFDAQVRFLAATNKATTATTNPLPQFKYRAWEPEPLAPTTDKAAYSSVSVPTDPGRSTAQLDFSQQESTVVISIRASPIMLAGQVISV